MLQSSRGYSFQTVLVLNLIVNFHVEVNQKEVVESGVLLVLVYLERCQWQNSALVRCSRSEPVVFAVFEVNCVEPARTVTCSNVSSALEHIAENSTGNATEHFINISLNCRFFYKLGNCNQIGLQRMQ